MRIGTSTDKVEIECADVEGSDSPRVGDICLVVSVHFGDFSGRVRAWVEQRSWAGFLDQLRELEQRREGAAILEGISPGTLSLNVRVTDRAGHMAVQGLIGERTTGREILMEFSPISFD